ncbi:putative late blight resistance protein homolog R1A-3 [Coffea arabica]|uniref:Late blight resistance protein homolog R1A-3 n=1 Tax=Coffea arabica TaxID=13443 RepID=A0A6P6SUN5_COFAR|nr:putative late blight resistance protein homolog R1A-3 [Coffea arabica]
MGCAFVDIVLNALEHLAKDLDVESHLWTGLRMDLRLLRTFVLCARSSNRLISWESLGSFMRSIFLYFKSDENASLGSLLHSLEDAVDRIGKELDFIRFGVEERFYPQSHMKAYFIGMAEDFRGSLWSFTQKISESYSSITAVGYSLQSRDELMEFIDSLLANMEDLVDLDDLGDVHLRALISSFKEKLEFFKRFIHFAELKGFQHKQLKVLLTHLELVAVNAAASVFFISTGRKRDAIVRDEMKTKISGVLAKFVFFEPQIRESYIKVLTATHWKRSSNILETNKDRLEGHVHFLLDSLDKLLNRDAVLIICFEEQIPLLYKGLRFLETILMKYPEKFDELHEKEKDLIRAAVNEAGIIICLLFLHDLKEILDLIRAAVKEAVIMIYILVLHNLKNILAKEFDLSLFNFMGKIKLVKVVTSTFIFSRNNELGFMDFLLEKLKELPSCEVGSIAFPKDQIQTIREDLVSVRSFLEISVDQSNQALRRPVMEVAHKTQLTVKSLFIGDFPDFWSPIIFDSIREELKEINLAKIEAMKVCDNKYRLEAHSVSRTTNKVRVRLEDEARIIHKLTRGHKQLGFVSIVGMPGIGKTTLAQNVYNDLSIRCFFHVRAWCTVSQLYQQKDLLLQILSCMDPDLFDDQLQRKKHHCGDEYSKKTEDEMEQKLRQRLMKNRYLIVLDDVWSSEVWNTLERSFPDNANGSKILLTSRLPMVALEINENVTIHHLQRLTDKESWELLQKKLPEEEGYPSAHSDLGMQIAKHCQGLPLTIVTVAGILAKLEKDGWIEIVERLRLSAVCATDHCMNVLELSYRHLPEYLKPCFLYFAAFPEDTEIPSWRLMSLWIAEGFVQKSVIKSLEDVAEEYIYELISRSLVMVSKERSLGGVRTCRIHDLLHEFCLVKAQKENFLQFLHGDDKLFTFDEPRNLRRLCIFSGQDIFAYSRLCSTRANSLMFYAQEDEMVRSGFPKFLFVFFKRLRVLDLEQFCLHGELPSKIGLLSELRYLAIHLSANSIPSSVGNLSYLETFIVQADRNVLLPDTIWNLKKLRRLDARNGFTFNLAEENLGSLHNLDSISVLFLSSVQSERILEKFPNIRRLKCKLFKSEEYNGDCNKIVAMDFLSQLESLKLMLDQRRRYTLEFRFPLISLKKLSLLYFHWSEIPMIGKLCNLEVFKLGHEISRQDTWDMEGFEFPRLKYLKLEQLRIFRWKCSSDQFPRLRKLVLVRCWRLKEVPSCFGEVSTLEMIDVHGCSDSAVRSVWEIEEEQKDSGNEDFQIFV